MAPRGQELLTALAQAPERETVSVQQLVLGTGRSAADVSGGLRILADHRLALHVRLGEYRITDQGRQALVDHGGIFGAAPRAQQLGTRPGTLRWRGWRALRMVRSATITDLLVLAGTGQERAGRRNLEKYLRGLARAEYVVAKPRRHQGAAVTSPGSICWLLVRDTGPAAPRLYQQEKRWVVSDPNTGEITPCKD